MKTSLLMADNVCRRAVKRRAAATHRTGGELVDEALRNWLAKEAAQPRPAAGAHARLRPSTMKYGMRSIGRHDTPEKPASSISR